MSRIATGSNFREGQDPVTARHHHSLPSDAGGAPGRSDSRPSIEERDPAKEDWLWRVQQAAEARVQQGYLLAEDLPTVTAHASQRYDLYQSRVSAEKV